ncbi:hypothetical protein [Streptomyces profundus]|uniref:hypothetical protein n=1 Tax=Streptomyces profundus TaxID=2867410 RepID=UPI001D169619|nr:hypothetical protein [Streptomyces sp. MA3_2.13]UED84191.1 hypothetical protein K4G22_08185 [Streptomyces sp. MA3_2.13]
MTNPPNEQPTEAPPEEPERTSEPDPHAALLARLRARNAASEVNYRVKSGELP